MIRARCPPIMEVVRKRIFLMIWVINALSVLPVIQAGMVSEVVTGMLGYNISLSCPVGSATNHSRRSVQDWYRGNVSNPGAMIARLITKGLRVEYNYTINKKKWIITMAGELFIQKLTLEDAGFYICRFTGSGAQAIELHVEGDHVQGTSTTTEVYTSAILETRVTEDVTTQHSDIITHKHIEHATSGAHDKMGHQGNGFFVGFLLGLFVVICVFLAVIVYILYHPKDNRGQRSCYRDVSKMIPLKASAACVTDREDKGIQTHGTLPRECSYRARSSGTQRSSKRFHAPAERSESDPGEYRELDHMSKGYETLGKTSAHYSMPAMRPGRNMEHVYNEIGPPVLPPRGYRDDYMAEGDTLLDEHNGSLNATPLANLGEGQSQRGNYTNVL